MSEQELRNQLESNPAEDAAPEPQADAPAAPAAPGEPAEPTEPGEADLPAADAGAPAEQDLLAEAVEAPAQKPARRRVWYVIHTYSGYEVKVKKALEQRIAEQSMQKEIFQVVVPTEEEVEIKDGHRRTVERRVFPGYVLVEMLEFVDNDERSDEAWYLIRGTNGVTSFVGEGATQPTPLSASDVDKIMGRMHQAQPKVKINFKVGNSVRITDGPFADFVGTVDELMVDKGKVRVLVNFFGRETPVELDFIQVEKQ